MAFDRACVCVLEDMCLFALAKKSEPENTIQDPYIWAAAVLLPDRELLLERFLVGDELLLLVYLKYALPFSPLFQRGAFVLFQNVWKSSIYRVMEDVFCQFLGSAALSESQWNQKDKSASALLLQFGVHFLTHFPPLPHTAATCRLVSTGPFRNLLWFHPLLIALWFYAEFQTN